MYFSRIRLKPEFFKNTQLDKVLSESAYSIHRLLWDLFPSQKQRDFLYREEIAREQLGIRANVLGEPVYYLVSASKPLPENPILKAETKEYSPKLQEGDQLNFELRANPVVTQKGDRENSERYLKERNHRQVANKTKLTKKRVRHDVVIDAQRTFLRDLCEEFHLMSYISSSPEKSEFKKILLAYGNHSLHNRLTTFLTKDSRYAERLSQKMDLRDKLEWSLKTVVDSALCAWLEKQGLSHGFELLKDQNRQAKLQNSAYRWHDLPKKTTERKKCGFSSVDFVGDLRVTDVKAFTKALFDGVGRSKAFGCGLMLVRRI